jgi:hypothetical protein
MLKRKTWCKNINLSPSHVYVQQRQHDENVARVSCRLNSDKLILRQQLLRVKGRLDEQIQNIQWQFKSGSDCRRVNNKKMREATHIQVVIQNVSTLSRFGLCKKCNISRITMTLQSFMMKKLFFFSSTNLAYCMYNKIYHRSSSNKSSSVCWTI